MVHQTADNNKIHIIYTTDDNFAEVMGVSIISLFENNKDCNFCIYILDSGVKESNKKKVNEVFAQYERNLPVWISAININEVLGIEVKQDRGSISQFARLFVARVLPDNLGRVLYLDCDIIIRQSIIDLWNMDLHGNTIAALKDPFSKYYRRNLGLEDNDIIFNSGIMLIDFQKWQERHIEDKILSLIKNYNGLIPQGDQGALGAVLSKETEPINPKFNAITLFYDFSYEDMLIYRKPVDYYSKAEVEAAKNNPSIVHFTTSFKSIRPWIEESEHPYAKEWLEYKMNSPWRHKPLGKYQKTQWWKEGYIKFYSILPKWFSIRLSSLLQAYGRPWLIKIRYRIKWRDKN